MKELWMDLGAGFIYYKTSKTTLKEAMKEFLSKLDAIGAIHDNFGWEAVELRYEHLDPIEGESMGAGCPNDLF